MILGLNISRYTALGKTSVLYIRVETKAPRASSYALLFLEFESCLRERGIFLSGIIHRTLRVRLLSPACPGHGGSAGGQSPVWKVSVRARFTNYLALIYCSQFDAMGTYL